MRDSGSMGRCRVIVRSVLPLWLAFATWATTVGTNAARPGSEAPGAPAVGPPANAPPSSAAAPEEPSALQAEILEIARTGGLEGVLAWAEANRSRVTAELVAALAKQGNRRGEPDCFRVALSLAEFRGDAAGAANVRLAQGELSRLQGDLGQAEALCDQALAEFEKIGEAQGKGRAWLGKGLICYVKGQNPQALERFDRALACFETAADLRGQGDAWLAKGDVCRVTGDTARAQEMYERARLLFEQASAPAGQGKVFYRQGLLAYLEGANDRAIQLYDQALPLLENAEELLGQANIWLAKGNVYYFTGDNTRALEMFDRALPLYERLSSLQGQANIWSMRGDIYHHAGERQKAQEMYDQALALCEKTADLQGQAYVLSKKGDAYSHVGDTSKALQLYDQALPLFEQVADPLGQAGIWRGRAAVFYKTGQTDRALEAYSQALPFYEKVGEPLGQGGVYRGQGDLYLDQGDYGRALRLFERALFFYEKGGDPVGLGGVHLSMGLAYHHAGEYGRALEEYDKALVNFEKADHLAGQGYVRQFQGDTCQAQGELQRALQMYDLALPFLERTQNLIGQGNVHKGKADVLRLSGDYPRALAEYERALPFYVQDSSPMGQGNVWTGKGDVYLNSGRWQQALAMYERAGPYFERIGANDVTAFLTISKAEALAGMGKTAAAADLYERGLAALEQVRRQVRLPDLSRTFLAKVYANYETAARFLLAKKMPERAFRVVESLRARGFLDRLAESRVDLAKGIPPELKEKRDQLLHDLETATKNLAEDAVSADAAGLKLLVENRQTAEGKLALVEESIRLNNPLYASVQYPAIVTAGELRQGVLRPGEVLVEYFLGRENCWAFVATPKSFAAVPLQVTQAQLEDAARDFLAAVERRQDPATAGRRLAQMVWQPLEKKLPIGHTLWVVPDGLLARVPFEALPVSEKRGASVYLLETWGVRYIQSATVLAFLRAHGGKRSPAADFTGFGDPVYDYDAFRSENPEQGGLARRSGESALEELRRGRWERAGVPLERLPATGREVAAIDSFFAGAGRGHRKLLRLEASEEAVKDPRLKMSGYIHFACHGLLGDDYQSLALSRVPNSAEDGFLDAGEIMNLDWNARLVVLSACETGKGKLELGEGVTGLTRAVMYAGSPAVAASLWSVSDEGTAELMTRFYQRLVRERQDPAGALRSAKLELLRGGPASDTMARNRDAASAGTQNPFAHPYFWAAFVIYGE